MSDLSQFDTKKLAPKGRKMPVLNPVDDSPLYEEQTVEGETVKLFTTITLLSQDSDPYKAAAKKATDRQLQKQVKRGRKMKLDASELEADALELLVAATVGWDNVRYEGAVLEFSPAAARKLYSELPWLREQVDEFIANRGNFLGN